MKKYMLAVVGMSMLFLFGCSSGKEIAFVNQELEKALSSDNWLFTAQQSNPQPPANRGLDAGYELKCQQGQLQSYLPYFGRSYSGTAAYTNQNPLDFKTTEYTIQRSNGKKGSKVLLIRPGSIAEILEYRLTVFNNGRANLDVTFNSRSPISFSGQVTAIK
jgi:hypothetical protein